MKKGIITLCMVMVVVFSMVNIAFADTHTSARTENRQISSETEQFLYGDWKIKTFLGLQMTTKDDNECPGGENFWIENDMAVAITDPDYYNEAFYQVYYHDKESELVPEDDRIRLLMINGGLVPYPDIKVVNDRTLVPLRLVSELLGAKVDWDEKKETIDITEGKTKIRLTINSAEASINDNIKTLDVTPVILDGKTYVPVRFIAEALAADVGYVSSFGSGMEKTVSTVSVVTIEKPDRNAKVYSIEEGLVKVKEASIEEYKIAMETFKGWNGTFDDNFKDYDAQDIFYTNQTCGRYYVYRLTAFPERNIFFNRYTGELYGECYGSSNFLEMCKGFTDISWGYQ